MERYLFIVRNNSGDELAAAELLPGKGLMYTAHSLIDTFRRIGAVRCEIWMRTEHAKMILLGTAF